MGDVYTPGPWGVEVVGHTLFIGPLRPNSTKVAEIVCVLDVDPTYKADVLVTRNTNARLIAAAPSLLEALTEAQSFLLDRFGHANAQHDARASHVLTQLSAAIEKVRS